MYFDPAPTYSGAIRCLGPFGLGPTAGTAPNVAIAQMAELMSRHFPDSYLVWGSYEIDPYYREHTFPLIGQFCGFSPKMCLGGEIYPDIWLDEWTITGPSATHRSGITFGGELRTIDAEVFHPASFQAEIEMCRRFLVRLLDWPDPLPTIHRAPQWRALARATDASSVQQESLPVSI